MLKLLLQRFFVFGYVLVLIGVAVFLSLYFTQTWREYQGLRQKEELTRTRLQEAETRLAEQETTLRRLRSDPAYVELVIRRRLGFVRPEEFVIRFDD